MALCAHAGELHSKVCETLGLPARSVAFQILLDPIIAFTAGKIVAAEAVSGQQLATAHGLRGIAFPGISASIYKYPKELAARVAVETVRGFTTSHALITGAVRARDVRVLLGQGDCDLPGVTLAALGFRIAAPTGSRWIWSPRPAARSVA